jgi:hypothetical protein
MKRTMLILVPLPILAITMVASAFGGGGQSELSSLRQATAKYHNLQAAMDAGYTVELPQTEAFGGGTCIANGAEGAMGIHLVSPGRIDGNLDAADPEVLLYERRNNGTLKLTGVEYIVAGGAQPELYGQDLADTNLARYGDPATNVWTLHAWVWKPNPDGMFDPWNTRVTCD